MSERYPGRREAPDLHSDTKGTLLGGDGALIGLHFKLRWLRLANDIDDYTHLLDRQELRALWRWRVSGDRTQDLKSRVDFARKVRAIDSSFPIYTVVGNLYAQEGQEKEALALYREALLDSPFDVQVAANFQYLMERVAYAARTAE